MRRIGSVLLLVVVSLSLHAQPVTVIKAGTLIDGKSAQPRTNQVIVIRGNRIELIGGASTA